jgi:hypothetical protein
MSNRSALLRTGKLAAVALLAIVASACSGSAGESSSSNVTCTSYTVHGTGTYHDEVQVQVGVSNSSSAAADYQVDVDMTLTGPTAGSGDVHVTLSGLVPAKASGTLTRKVLTASKAQHCTIGRLTRS